MKSECPFARTFHLLVHKQTRNSMLFVSETKQHNIEDSDEGRNEAAASVNKFSEILRSCHGLDVTNSATISAVDKIIRQNRRITTREIAVELSISKETVQHIVHKNLGDGKVRTVGAQGSVRESEDGENGCLIGPGVSTLKPSTPSYALG
ncbi:hypothetical protein AVEN_5845-1 [Araneus ventricosus]|uniref:Uncharacterized protein n=1 Tax=Araneus ventricosus TaxID=182803 RepID=A0A4Y2S7F6_ARAVE|nr:hypothetical protein AVEN_5845-1 [Araneus ventricosus]